MLRSQDVKVASFSSSASVCGLLVVKSIVAMRLETRSLGSVYGVVALGLAPIGHFIRTNLFAFFLRLQH